MEAESRVMIRHKLTLSVKSVTDDTNFQFMPRDGEKVRRRLQQAALELFQERGYDRTTAAEIAARAGVTERTFFRHFPDKREVLFDGQAILSDALRAAVRVAPPAFGPWETLYFAFRSLEPIFVENRAFSEPRRRVIAGNPTLQERELAKTGSMVATLASALRGRGIEDPLANLAAQIGVTTLGHAIGRWLDGAAGGLEDHLAHAFRDVRDLSSSGLEQVHGAQGVPRTG